ncbi:MAG: SRPBCC domain-containing protein [Chloroflexi bacterium]|nr:SRPBCC domain-containing protein [Chloroflexota bacterium]MBV9898636.1 SRPBCC domain-containing protein [Chloroflexota bacterium]
MAEFRTSIDIEAPPETVFAHLVTPERMVSWMGERADLEPVPGGRFAVDIGGVPFRGEYLEVEQPHRVVVSWGLAGSDDFPPGVSRVEFTLQPTPRGTTLHLLHTGLPESHAATHGLGWAHYLSRLQHSASGNPPGPDPGFLISSHNQEENAV